MNIASTQYSLDTKSFEIYLSGCNGSCKGCCNPELKDFNVGDELTSNLMTQIINKIKKFDILIENIWILGGDPMDQNVMDLITLLYLLKTNINKKIWLFTRYSIESIDETVKSLVDYIKCGEYLEELKTDDNIQYGVKLATQNQRIYKLNGGQIN